MGGMTNRLIAERTFFQPQVAKLSEDASPEDVVETVNALIETLRRSQIIKPGDPPVEVESEPEPEPEPEDEPTSEGGEESEPSEEEEDS